LFTTACEDYGTEDYGIEDCGMPDSCFYCYSKSILVYLETNCVGALFAAFWTVEIPVMTLVVLGLQ
jgi:hypothetical protein